MEGKFGGDEFKLALFSWRNTPRADGFSPAYAFLGRQIRGLLPDARDHVSLDRDLFHQKRLSATKKVVERNGGKDLRPLVEGEHVYCQDPKTNRWTPGGVVTSLVDHGRSFLISNPNGVFRRNRRLLRPLGSDDGTDDPVLQPGMPEPMLSKDEVRDPPRRSPRIAKQTNA
ncbi:hypothetical protein TCAL_14162 [Tigriopus californicus]|uniref:Uncharacterized protein n=1 Tax=Tigriopus californicus TaxID=6832 RepID=A0A553PU62_TIGCA|nr:hypothetical protein TCAL_14162 [Tigriopus californicus]|eukprot:TCALIF_14162-PA protein Name:"Protein of unknown function" AED:0.33 eAED:0.33 QI:0/-1/0/1/-1/1/1/0/170